MNKKGADISINVIIVAAIGLAVLVVLFLIFTGRLGIFSKGVSDTASCENGCRAIGKTSLVGGASDKASCELNQGTFLPGTYGDVGQGVCCCT